MGQEAARGAARAACRCPESELARLRHAEGINDWFVHVVEEPKTLTAKVVLEVVDRDGAPDPAMAHSLRQVAKGDGGLARAPTEEEWSFLIAQRKERGYGNGYPVR